MCGGERIFLALGSNLGNRRQNLLAAVQAIALLPDTNIIKVSTFVESSPWGVTDQPNFLNAVIEIESPIEPEDLLTAIKGIESSIGRKPSYHWGPRLIDIDIILYGNRVINSEALVIPHPRAKDRIFVMSPLHEIAPEIASQLAKA